MSCDLGNIIRGHMPAMMQLLADELKEYNMSMVLTKCLNTAVIMWYLFLGGRCLGEQDRYQNEDEGRASCSIEYCDARSVQSRGRKVKEAVGERWRSHPEHPLNVIERLGDDLLKGEATNNGNNGSTSVVNTSVVNTSVGNRPTLVGGALSGMKKRKQFGGNSTPNSSISRPDDESKGRRGIFSVLPGMRPSSSIDSLPRSVQLPPDPTPMGMKQDPTYSDPSNVMLLNRPPHQSQKSLVSHQVPFQQHRTQFPCGHMGIRTLFYVMMTDTKMPKSRADDCLVTIGVDGKSHHQSGNQKQLANSNNSRKEEVQNSPHNSGSNSNPNLGSNSTNSKTRNQKKQMGGQEETRFFPGHVYIIEKFQDLQSSGKIRYNIYQSYIDNYTLDGHLEARTPSSSSLSTTTIRKYLDGMRALYSKSCWNREDTKFWMWLTRVDCSNLEGFEFADHSFVCYKAASTTNCLSALRKYLVQKLNVLLEKENEIRKKIIASKENATIGLSDTDLNDWRNKIYGLYAEKNVKNLDGNEKYLLTNEQMKGEIIAMLDKI